VETLQDLFQISRISKMKKLFQIGDLLRYHFGDNDYHYAIVLKNDDPYVVHWLDPHGNPNDEYIVKWFESEMPDYFQKIS
jgi:hypothetical protein